MFTQSRFNVFKTAASLLAAASLAACGGGGGSGGGSVQAAGSISVKNPVTIDDVVTVEFRDCRSEDFSAKLDGIDVTPLFSLDKADKKKACQGQASVYALQGILGEQAQAKKDSKLVVKVKGRTDINKSFGFKAWPEFALSYKGEVVGEAYNALLSTNGGVTAIPSGVSNVTGKQFTVAQPLDFPLTIKAEATNGLKNEFTLALGGETITDSSVLQFPTELKSEHIISQWVESFLGDVGDVEIKFGLTCDKANELCPTIKVDNVPYLVNISVAANKKSFEVVATGTDLNIAKELENIVKALGSVLLRESDSQADIESNVEDVTLTPPAFVSVSRSVSYYGAPASYFAQGEGSIKDSLKKTNQFYIAATSNEINQRLLAETLRMQWDKENYAIKGEIPLCDSGDCTLRNELIKLATPTAEEMAKAIGMISAAQARKLLENILTKDQKIVYKLEPLAAPPYVRFLNKQLELSAYNVFLELKLSDRIDANTVCSKIFTGLLLTGCKGELPSGIYTLQLGDIALKQRVLVNKNVIEVSDLLQTSLHVNDFFTVGNKTYAGQAFAQNGSSRKGGGLDKQAILPVLYGMLGELPIEEVSNFKLADLTQSNTKVELDCTADPNGVLENFIGDGKELSFKDSDLNIGETTTGSDTKEAKHLILSGDIIETPSGTTPDVTITCKKP